VGLRERLYRQEFFYHAFNALAYNKIEGDYVEFGSHGGMTFSLAYHEAQRHSHNAKFWAFDSFRGLPAPKDKKDDHPVWQEGSMSTSIENFHLICKNNRIPRNKYDIVPGFYENTLPMISLTDQPSDISLAYIDCDLYSSSLTVLTFLLPRLKHGMIIAFDDYFCYSSSQISGERRAMREVFNKHQKWELVPYIQYGWAGNSFIVEDKNLYDN